jgi:replicative DNA helicase
MHLNRGAHQRADEKLALSDPRESGSVGKDAAG